MWPRVAVFLRLSEKDTVSESKAVRWFLPSFLQLIHTGQYREEKKPLCVQSSECFQTKGDGETVAMIQPSRRVSRLSGTSSVCCHSRTHLPTRPAQSSSHGACLGGAHKSACVMKGKQN